MSGVQQVKLYQRSYPDVTETCHQFELDGDACDLEGTSVMYRLLREGATIEGRYIPEGDFFRESFQSVEGYYFHLNDIETEVVKS